MDSQPLPRLGAWGNPKLDRSLERRHVDARAERRLVHRHRELAHQIVAFAPKPRVGLDMNRHIQVAGAAAVPASVSHLHDAQPAAVGNPCRHHDARRFSANTAPLSRTDRATFARLPPFATARRARLGEHHVAARPADLTRTAALPALRFGNCHLPRAAARTTHHLTRDQDLPLDAVDGVGERHGQRRVQVCANFRTLQPAAGYRMQDVGEELRECRRLRSPFGGGEIELREHERRRFHPRTAVLPRRVVLPPSIGINQRLVRLDNPLKHLLGGPITRVDTRMVAASQAAVRPLDVRRARLRRHAEDDVIVHVAKAHWLKAQGSGKSSDPIARPRSRLLARAQSLEPRAPVVTSSLLPPLRRR